MPQSTLPSTPPLLSQVDGIATITLNRPAQRNRLQDEDLHQLIELFTRVDADPSVRVLILTANTEGQPKTVFCAGYNVGDFDAETHDPRLFESVPDALEKLRPLTLCALNGSVYGGATDIVLACDIRLAMVGGEMRMPAAALGLHYYPSGLRRYVSALGLSMAKRAFLTGLPIPFEQLATLGAFESLLPVQEWESGVQTLSHTLAQLAPLAAQSTKQSLNDIARGQWDEPTLRARETQTLQSHDFAEGRAAFAERRTSKFTGH